MTALNEKLSVLIADRLDKRADGIVIDWIEWIRSRIKNPTVDALPHRALKNHIPPVIKALTNYIISPTYAVREDMLGHLRLHGQIRRDQGYEAIDLMAEFDGLSHMISRAMQKEFNELEDSFSVEEVLEVFSNLSDGLRAMSYVTLSVYQEAAEGRQQELARRLSDFGNAIGHELKNPLQTIRMSAELLKTLRKGDASEVEKEQFAAIAKAVRFAVGLIDDIDLLALAQGGESRSRMVSLPQIVEDLRVQLGSMAQERDVELIFQEEIPRVAVEGLVGTLVLVNLINNGIKYSDPAKKKRWVRLSARVVEGSESPFIEIEISDNGMGIEEDLQLRVFQRGFRAHPGHAEGTGLGLAISQELVIERGGRIELDSKEGKGSTFTVLLRAIDSEAVGSAGGPSRPEDIMQHSVDMVIHPYDGEESS